MMKLELKQTNKKEKSTNKMLKKLPFNSGIRQKEPLLYLLKVDNSCLRSYRLWHKI